MFKWVKDVTRRVLRRMGFEVFAYNHRRIHELRKAKLLGDLGITLVFDVGANAGQFGKRLRASNYRGRIVSFEPIPSVFTELQACAARDPAWTAVNLAIGERNGTSEINVAEFSQVSSLLPATGVSITHSWTATTRHPIELRRLDSIASEYLRPDDRVYLKLDVQGYERQVLLGASSILNGVLAIELEVSTLPLYEGEWLMPEMMSTIGERGFGVFSIDTVAVDHVTGRVIQFEVLFVNDALIKVRCDGDAFRG
jgi:FkbM family methyltransferase